MNEVVNHFKCIDPKKTLNELWIKYIEISEKVKTPK